MGISGLGFATGKVCHSFGRSAIIGRLAIVLEGITKQITVRT